MKPHLFKEESIHRNQFRQGFTLTELLICVVIVAVLGTLSLAGYSMILKQTKQNAELHAARQVITAYLAYPVDHHGQLMPGRSGTPVPAEDGSEFFGPFAQRWPLRLGPYLNFQYPGVVVVNEREAAYYETYENSSASVALYMASLFPTFGINTTFVGGNVDRLVGEPRLNRDEPTYGEFAVTRMGQAHSPGQLIVFVSAGRKSGTQLREGYYYIYAPNSSRNWLGGSEAPENPNDSGFVHARWNNRAVAAHLDGSVGLLDYAELKDMTRWSNQAALASDPNWYLGKY